MTVMETAFTVIECLEDVFVDLATRLSFSLPHQNSPAYYQPLEIAAKKMAVKTTDNMRPKTLLRTYSYIHLLLLCISSPLFESSIAL